MRVLKNHPSSPMGFEYRSEVIAKPACVNAERRRAREYRR
jgi:hypothetical protein